MGCEDSIGYWQDLRSRFRAGTLGSSRLFIYNVKGDGDLLPRPDRFGSKGLMSSMSGWASRVSGEVVAHSLACAEGLRSGAVRWFGCKTTPCIRRPVAYNPRPLGLAGIQKRHRVERSGSSLPTSCNLQRCWHQRDVDAGTGSRPVSDFHRSQIVATDSADVTYSLAAQSKLRASRRSLEAARLSRGKVGRRSFRVGVAVRPITYLAFTCLMTCSNVKADIWWHAASRSSRFSRAGGRSFFSA
jgi:hypothetical protein